MTKLYLKKAHKDVKTPTLATKYSAAHDIYAFSPDEPVHHLSPGETKIIPTGLHIQPAKGYHTEIFARSGLAASLGITLGNAVGIADRDYFKGIGIILHNAGRNHVEIRHEERIAQLQLKKTEPVEIIEVDELPELDSDRTGGYGSTGK